MIVPKRRQQGDPTLQQALSRLLASQHLRQMSRTVLTETDPARLSGYAAVVVMNAVGEQQRRLAELFAAIKVLPRTVAVRVQ